MKTAVRPNTGLIVMLLLVLLVAIALILMIVVMVGAHWWAKKGTKHLWRWGAALAWLAVVAIVVNMICYGPLKNNVAGFLKVSKAMMAQGIV